MKRFISTDAGYQGPKSAMSSAISARTAYRRVPAKVNALKQHPRKNKLAIRYGEYLKAKVSELKVEHPFG